MRERAETETRLRTITAEGVEAMRHYGKGYGKKQTVEASGHWSSGRTAGCTLTYKDIGGAKSKRKHLSVLDTAQGNGCCSE